MPNEEKPKSGGVDAVDRALSILSCFNAKDGKLTLTEIASRTGLYKSTTLRLIESLENAGFLIRSDTRGYTLGAELMRLGSLYSGQFKLEDRIRPVLIRLVEETGESASFFLQEGSHRVCLYREDSQHPIRDHIREGDLLALDKGAAGHVLTDCIGKSDDVLRRLLISMPYTSYGERDAETAAVAAPVFGMNNALLGAISVSGPRSRFSPERSADHKLALRRRAADLSGSLGGTIYIDRG